MQANPALGVQAFFNSTAATAALLSVGPCEERLRCLFLSLLVQPGTLLFKRGADKSDIGYVLSVSEFAALVWRVSPHIADGKRFITFETPPNKPVWEYWAITSLADWVCQATDVMLPSVGALDGGDTSGSIGVGVPSDAQHSILRYSAEHGFKGMTITFLKRLVVSLDIVPNEGETNPTREFELVKMLIQHVFPDVDEETIAIYMARRHSKWDVRFCSDLRHADIADVVDVLGEQDASELASEVKAYMKQAEEDKEKAKTAAAAAKPKPKKMPKVKKCTLKHLGSIETARKLLPPGAGLYVETEWHTRWRGTYPSAYPPFSSSRSDTEGNAAKSREALVLVLTWLWSRHQLATGIECPYDFSVAVTP